MKSGEQEIKQAAATVGDVIAEKKQEEIAAAIKNVTRGPLSLQDNIGFSDAMVEGVYAQAYRLYNTGKYREAAQLFRTLIMIDPGASKFSMGLAACLHMAKDYAGAVKVYTLLNVIDAKNPVPFYHMSDCLIQMKDSLSALLMLKMAVKYAGEKPVYQVLKSRALLMIENLEKEIKDGKTLE